MFIAAKRCRINLSGELHDCCNGRLSIPLKDYPVDTRPCFNIYKTSIRRRNVV